MQPLQTYLCNCADAIPLTPELEGQKVVKTFPTNSLFNPHDYTNVPPKGADVERYALEVVNCVGNRCVLLNSNNERIVLLDDYVKRPCWIRLKDYGTILGSPQTQTHIDYEFHVCVTSGESRKEMHHYKLGYSPSIICYPAISERQVETTSYIMRSSDV